MNTISVAAFAIAVMWVLALALLPIEFSGSSAIGVVTNLLAVFTGITMLIFAVNIDRAATAPSPTLRAGALVAGILGSLLYAGGSAVLILSDRGFDEMAPWTLGAGLGLFGLWMIWLTLQAPEAIDLVSGLRWLGLAVGIGFVLFSLSVISIGPIDPTASDAPSMSLMLILQYAGGLLAYLGWPVWLVLIGRRLL